jgi:beta-mannosidase
VEIDVPNPKLWWPIGYGEANLYDLDINLLYKGKVIATKKDIMGIRSVELLHSDNRGAGTREEGEFLFKVNNIPVLFKGSNWVPADVFHSRDADKYEKMLELFHNSNCNLVRSWGGSVYEDHAFFNICDKYGMMVWQDFSMACARYPQTTEFKEVMYKEAVSVIKKLRNHPSILLWSGDNECDSAFNGNGLDPANNKITREVLPWAVSQYDPYRLYLGSSPYLSPFTVAKRDETIAPEQHLWGPRDYYKSKFYAQNTAHFVSEMGYQGSPNLSSIKRFIDEEHLWPWQENSQWITHCTDSLGDKGTYVYRIKLMADQIKELFGMYPDNIEDFVIASQISQAEAKKYFIEMVRLKKWSMTGIIWWNMIDGWPQFSDAVVDYYMGKKLAYHYISRVQEPFCIMIDDPESWHVKVVAGNDSLVNQKGSYRIWDADTEEVLLQGEFSVKANENEELGKIRISHSDSSVLLIQWTINEEIYGNHYLLGYPAFSLDTYKGWLKKIAALKNDFSAEEVGK